MYDVITTVLLGSLGYLLTKFFFDPLFNILNLRQEMHIAILKYANLWGLDVERQKVACEEYRLLAARGIAECENLSYYKIHNFCFLNHYLKFRNIDMGEAAKSFWIMSGEASRPDENLRKETVSRIYEYLNLPREEQEKK